MHRRLALYTTLACSFTVLVAALVISNGAASSGEALPPVVTGNVPKIPPTGTANVLAVGDTGACDSTGDEQVAALVRTLPGTILLLGDIAYPDGSVDNFNQCFLPSWRPVLARTHAALGNHEYGTPGAVPARQLFGLQKRSWQAFTLGAWRIILLDSNCKDVGCEAGSAQWRWLRKELRTNPRKCTLAGWHHPLHTSSTRSPEEGTRPLWQLLSAARTDLVLWGHEHHYERFAPIDGIATTVVGTGGRSLYNFGEIHASSLVRDSSSYGVLRLRLGPSGWTWRFAGIPGAKFRDSGTARCR